MYKLVCAFALYLCTTAVAFAGESPDCPLWTGAHPDAAKLRAFVCSADVDTLEKYFTHRQQEYESGAIDDGELLQSFDTLTQFPPERFEEWLKRYPNSYAARVAFAELMTWEALATRSTDVGLFATPIKYLSMYSLQRKAEDHLKRSLSLTKKPYYSYYALIRAERIMPTPYWRRDKIVPSPAAKEYLDKAIALDRPASIARGAYMISMQPDWNGNPRAMRRHFEDSRNVGLKKAQLGRLASMVLIEEASVMEPGEERLKVTIESNDQQENSRALRDIVWLDFRAERWAFVVPYARRALELNPGDYWVRSRRARALFGLERHAEAYKEFLLCARNGEAFAQNKVGWYLWMGTYVPQNKREGYQWFARAAAGGDTTAINNLRMAAAEEVSLRVEGKR